MPRVDRGAVRHRLFRTGFMPNGIMKLALFIGTANVQFANGVSDAIAPVRCSVAVTGIGRFRHPDADESNGKRRAR